MNTSTLPFRNHLPCTACGSSDALSEYEDGHTYCFSCQEYTPPAGLSAFTFEYLPWRGVSRETMQFFDVKTKIDVNGKPVELQFPYPNGHYKHRNLLQKQFFLDKGKALQGLFGANKFAAGGAKTVTITEGELDALSLYQVLKSPVVSVQSGASAWRDLAGARSWANAYDRIYLAFDADAVGREAVRECAKLFDNDKLYVLKFTNRKDANAYLEAGEIEQLRNLWYNARRYLPDNLVSSLDDFRKELSTPVKKGIAYPFKALTEMTYGIRTGETVLFTAQEKVGKTELMHFIEHKILKETEDNVGAIYLEEPKARHLRALAGIEISKPCHLPDSLVSPDEVISTIEKLIGQDDRLHLYSHFGSGDAELLLDTIRFLVSARKCRYVILDHLTMVVSGTSEQDERRALDIMSTKLEMMVKELDFALIMVSHVNDNGQTRGSRYPTKVADITVTATRDLQSLDLEERNTIYLRVLYNRFCGMTGPAGAIVFNPETYSFTEKGDNDNVKEADGDIKTMEDGVQGSSARRALAA